VLNTTLDREVRRRGPCPPSMRVDLRANAAPGPARRREPRASPPRGIRPRPRVDLVAATCV
jgi:hypothetical protein